MRRQFRLLGSRKTIQTGKRGKNDGEEKGTRLRLGRGGTNEEILEPRRTPAHENGRFPWSVVRAQLVCCPSSTALTLATVITLPSNSKNVAEES